MKLKDQVCSLELAQKLKELGVKQKSLFTWRNNVGWNDQPKEDEWIVTMQSFPGFPEICAFTVAELGEMLPAHLQIDKYQNSKFLWSVSWSDMRNESHSEKADTEAAARAKMLIHLIEKGIVTMKSIEGKTE